MLNSSKKTNVEMIVAPLFVSLISIHWFNISTLTLVLAILVGSIWFFTERYIGETFGLVYSFWRMQGDSSLVSMLSRESKFSKKRIILRINIFIMVAIAILDIFRSSPDCSRLSTLFGISLLAFLLFDFYFEYVRSPKS